MHQVDERVSREDLLKVKDIYALALKKYAVKER